MGQDGGIGLPTPVSELVDRETEIGEVLQLLGTSRLTTLTGPGGIGKTRLAIAAAHAALAAEDAAAEFADGAVFVPLAELAAGEDTARAVAAALDLSGPEGFCDDPATAEQHLVDALRGRSLLLVLDNCEHQLEGTASVALRLLTSCRGLTVLATSREPLGVPGETVWAVPPLSHPAASSRAEDDRAADASADETEAHTRTSAEWAAKFGAVQLFVLRAAQAAGQFELTDANARTVASICRRLDGIPLALELAAARVRALSVEEIEARLSDRFALLSGPFRFAETRHRTLRTSVEWSHQLLTADEQQLFAGLSVFSGGWTLHAAEALSPNALDPLTRLVDKSLVTVEPAPDGPRYSMLETLRAYASDQLERSGLTAKLRARHAAYFLELAETLNPLFYGPRQIEAFRQLDAEINNIRTAGRWFLSDPDYAGEALRLVGALWDFYCCRCHLAEGVKFARGALELADEAGLTQPSAIHARATLGLAALLGLQDEENQATKAAREVVALAQECGDVGGESYELRLFVINTLMTGYLEGDPAQFAERARRAEASKDLRLLAYLRVLMSLGELSGDRACHTITTLDAAFLDFHEVGDRYGRLLALSARLLAHLKWDRDLEAAALLIGKCESAYAGIGSGPLAVFAGQIAGAAETVRVALGADVYATAVQAGAQVTWDRLARALSDEVQFWDVCPPPRRTTDEIRAAAEEAVEGPDPPQTSAAPAPAAEAEPPVRRPTALAALAALTPREQEIAGHVALGRTNRRIAEDLVISERTVDTHVQRILAKLHLANRVQLAALLAGVKESGAEYA